MLCREFFSNSIKSLCATVIIIGSLSAVSAQVMQSGSYQMQSDSINFGGGFSSSTNYQQESTFGEVATGISTSTSYNLYAGYQQMLQTYMAITGAVDINLSPSLGGVTAGESDGDTTVTVTTDNPAGYSLSIEASESPAMRSNADTIDDYAPGGVPSFTFSVGSGEAFFAYTPEGDDIVTRFQDSGGVCNSAGNDTTLACWDGLTTSPIAIAGAASPNHPDGATTTIRFRVGVGTNSLVPPGTYIATTTVTALAL